MSDATLEGGRTPAEGRAVRWLLIALAVGFLALFLLNRSRDAASVSVTGVFRRINDRIDQSSRASPGANTARSPR